MLSAALLGLAFAAGATDCTVRKVALLPQGSDGHCGVAGAFTGVVDNCMVIACGSDFPGLKPWEGGAKKFYDDILLLTYNKGVAECRLLEGKFPRALAGGCAVSDGETLFCFGGSNEEGLSEAVWGLRMDGGAVKVDSLAVLPEGFAPAAAVFCRNEIYVHGAGSGGNELWRFSPSSRQWKSLSACPDRVIAEGCSAVCQHNGRESAIYIIGGRGTDGEGLHLSSAVWEYLPMRDEWTRKTDIMIDGEPSVLMYQGAVPYGSSHIVVVGGDDGKEFHRRAMMEREIGKSQSKEVVDSLQNELLASSLNHQGFSRKVLAYHTITDTWIEIGEAGFALPAVTTACLMADKIVFPSGEIRPGVRTGDVFEVSLREDINFGWVNYTVIVIYLLGMMCLGFYFYRRSKNTDHFFKGGGRIPWWAAGISIFATALSAITFLSIPAKAYMSDWGMFVFNMTIVLIVPIVIRFYLPFFRKLNVASVYQYLETRFGSPVRFIASSFFCLFMFVRVAIVLFLPALALNAVTGINVYLCIILMGGVTLLYCTMGGIEAVIWGDVVQGIILVGGAIVSLVFLISGSGGVGNVMETAVGAGKFNILDFSFDWTRPVFWVALIAGLANSLLTYTSDQSVVQRYITVKDERSTKKSIWLNGLLSIPVTILFFSIGTGLFVFFKSHPELLNVGMRNTDSIFPHFMMCRLPVGVAGLLIAAVFAAAMSTLSANINSTSTILTEDFFARFTKNRSDGRKMRFARLAGVCIGILGIVVALLMATFDIASLWDQFNFFLGLLTGGVGGLFMMGVFTKRIGMRSALTGFVGSVVIMLLCNAYSNMAIILYGFVGLVSSFVIAYLASFVYGYGK